MGERRNRIVGWDIKGKGIEQRGMSFGLVSAMQTRVPATTGDCDMTWRIPRGGGGRFDLRGSCVKLRLLWKREHGC